MEKQGIWQENIGKIILSQDNEFIWRLPSIFVYTYECCVSSPCFNFDGEKWNLVIMPTDGHGFVSSDNDYIALFLWMKSCNALKHEYNITLCIKTFTGKKRNIVRGITDFQYGFGKYNFLKLSIDIPDRIRHGLMNISCTIQRKENVPVPSCPANEVQKSDNETINSKNENQTDSILKGVDRLQQNFRNLLDSEIGCDVILKTGDHEFRAHKPILSVRSAVFSSMFMHEMTENITGEVDVADCSTEGFKVFLQYVYTGTADSMSPSNVLDVYYISDKYQVDDLKEDCIEYMKSILSIDNVLDIISLSLRHSESDLQNFATQFFCENFKKIVKTVQWQKYITENPTFANELIIKAIKA